MELNCVATELVESYLPFFTTFMLHETMIRRSDTHGTAL
jgi:hypothetical protein